MKKRIVGIVTLLTVTCTPVISNAGYGYNIQSFWNPFKFSSYFTQWFNKSNDSEIKEEVKLETPVLKMTNNTYTNSSRTMRFEWTKIENATGYEIQRATKEDFSDAVTTKNEKGYNSITYRINSGTGIYYYPAHKTYYVRVRAVGNETNSDWSNVIVSKAQ